MNTVYLTDKKVRYEEAPAFFHEAANWAKAHCKSFVDCHIQDVSDVSLTNDYISEYTFKDTKDALIFTLKWQK